MFGRAVGTALVGWLVLAGPAGSVAIPTGAAAVPTGSVAAPRPAGDRSAHSRGTGGAEPPAAGSGDARPGGVRSSFGWPLAPRPSVVRPFQAPAQSYGPGHRGADLAAAVGQPVLAAADGVVLYAGPLAGRGVVSIQHTGQLRTTYEPITALVGAGQVVRRGEVIGRLEPGHPGCPATACLHWGLLSGDDYLDPVPLLRAGHVRLLPWRDEQ